LAQANALLIAQNTPSKPSAHQFHRRRRVVCEQSSAAMQGDDCPEKLIDFSLQVERTIFVIDGRVTNIVLKYYKTPLSKFIKANKPDMHGFSVKFGR
jgi:hypothetical protein